MPTKSRQYGETQLSLGPTTVWCTCVRASRKPTEPSTVEDPPAPRPPVAKKRTFPWRYQVGSGRIRQAPETEPTAVNRWQWPHQVEEAGVRRNRRSMTASGAPATYSEQRDRACATIHPQPSGRTRATPSLEAGFTPAKRQQHPSRSPATRILGRPPPILPSECAG